MGTLVVDGLLDVEKDIQPVYDEYATLLDGLARQWVEDGTISQTFEGLPLFE